MLKEIKTRNCNVVVINTEYIVSMFPNCDADYKDGIYQLKLVGGSTFSIDKEVYEELKRMF